MAIFISHRGESCDAPENTVSAFKLAAKRKTDGIECDIYFTADKQVVCCHDENALRTSGHDALIPQTLFDTVRSWDFSYKKKAYLGERIPTLAETLACLKGDMQIYIEIKRGNVEMVPEMLKIIDASGVPQDRITMICFGQEVCIECKKLRPSLKTLWLAAYSDEKPITAKQLIAELRKCKADGVDLAGVYKYVDKKFVSEVKAAGFYFAVWTIDNASRAKELIDAGVDSITSNRAYAVMRELGLK
ncbi:MAG: hypothetical protein IJS15_11265 [Victivallales bacterium]|nr:hypothetical protein [Victivallales bacterium]